MNGNPKVSAFYQNGTIEIFYKESPTDPSSETVNIGQAFYLGTTGRIRLDDGRTFDSLDLAVQARVWQYEEYLAEQYRQAHME